MTKSEQLRLDSVVTGIEMEPVKSLELITITDYQGIDHIIFSSNPDYTRLKAAYDAGSRVFNDWDLAPDKAIEEAEIILEEAGMICNAAEVDNNLNMFNLFKSIMDDKYKPVISNLARTRFDMVTELYSRLLTEVERLESLEEYDTRYFRVLYQAAIVDLALGE
mgnify:CR=1 FL=1